jgi:glycosyltransferase involved in cell wall biosynthesis
MLIGIDASRATVQQRTGTEGYSYHILRGLIEQGEKHSFRLYFRDTPSPDLLPDASNVDIRVIGQKRLWTHMGLGPTVRRERPDVLFVPSHVVPWPDTGSVPSVVTTHDLGYLHYPDKHPLIERLYLDWSTRHSATTARKVIAVSNATKQDLIAFNNIPEQKIRVIHSGIDNRLRPVDNRMQINALCQRLGINGPYILHVGRVQSRKNLAKLVEAFAEIRDVLPDLKLVLAGREVGGQRAVMRRVKQMGLEKQVVLPGYVSDEDLPALYSGASVYGFPSLYEGFGFPALEAMACGTPVVCSNTSSLPELVGDAALTVAPTDAHAFGEALARLLTDASLRATLVERGLARAGQFTWAAAAHATLNVLIEAASA